MGPLLLKPVIKNYIWGGERLINEFGYKTDATPAAEAWVLSCRENEDCEVINGKRASHLSDVPGISKDSFPLIVKLIDAARDLSVQVHPGPAISDISPDDAEKSEMWYVVDCIEGSELIYGLKEEFERRAEEDPVQYEERIKAVLNGERIMSACRKMTVKPGDVIYVPPGTVHAIGHGILIAEVQQNSDTTYRVYDYDRKGADGRPRPLHTDKAAWAIANAPGDMSAYSDDTEELSFGNVRRLVFPKFKVEILSLSGKSGLREFSSFRSLLVLSGSANVISGGASLEAAKGDSVFVPEGCPFSLEGRAEILISHV